MLCLFFTLMVSYKVWKNRIEGTIMMKVYICPNCGWLRTVSRRKEVECFKCGHRTDDTSETDICQICGHVGTGTAGLFTELALYTQKRHKIVM